MSRKYQDKESHERERKELLLALSDNLYRLREENGLKQVEVCRMTGIAYSTLHTYELGDAIPGLHNLVKLAKFYNVTVDELIKQG